MFRTTAVTALTLLILAGCAAAKPPVPLKDTYGQWVVKGCKLENTRADVTIRTDAYTSNKTVRVEIQPLVPVSETPIVQINNNFVLNQTLEGKDGFWSFELPFELVDQADMKLDKFFLGITYKPVDSLTPLQAIFSLREVPDGVIAVAEHCHKLVRYNK